MTVGALLRTALQLLENDDSIHGEPRRARRSARIRPLLSFPWPRPPGRSGSRPSRRIAASRSPETPWRRSSRTGPTSPTPGRTKTPASSTARWWSSGWRTSPRSAGSETAAAMPCSRAENPETDPPAAAHRPRSPGGAAADPARPLDRYAALSDLAGHAHPVDERASSLGSSLPCRVSRTTGRSPAQALVQAGQDQDLPVADPSRPRLAHDGLDDRRRVLLSTKTVI